MNFWKLHYADGTPVLVNMDKAKTIVSKGTTHGSTIYFAGEEDDLAVRESLEQIEAMAAARTWKEAK